jgi:hypothetical protein
MPHILTPCLQQKFQYNTLAKVCISTAKGPLAKHEPKASQILGSMFQVRDVLAGEGSVHSKAQQAEC